MNSVKVGQIWVVYSNDNKFPPNKFLKIDEIDENKVTKSRTFPSSEAIGEGTTFLDVISFSTLRKDYILHDDPDWDVPFGSIWEAKDGTVVRTEYDKERYLYAKPFEEFLDREGYVRIRFSLSLSPEGPWMDFLDKENQGMKGLTAAKPYFINFYERYDNKVAEIERPSNQGRLMRIDKDE